MGSKKTLKGTLEGSQKKGPKTAYQKKKEQREQRRDTKTIRKQRWDGTINHQNAEKAVYNNVLFAPLVTFGFDK
jgi:hypothetical protein